MPYNSKEIYNEFWGKLKNPKEIKLMQDESNKPKIFLSMLFLELTLSISAGILISILKKADLIPSISIHNFVHKSPIWIVFMITVFISPFVEELLFRLSLRLKGKYMHLNILILIGGLIWILTPNFSVYYYKILIVSLAILVFLYYLNKKEIYNKILLLFWDRNFLYVFYFSVISFGLLHINNYEKFTNPLLLLLLPIIILPQLIVGLFCGYVRLKLGFNWGCILHASHNFLLLTPSLIFTLK